MAQIKVKYKNQQWKLLFPFIHHYKNLEKVN